MGPLTIVLLVSLALASAQASQLDSLVQANNQLALELHRILGAEDKGNIFISPLSISTALSMLMRGARGDTQDELYRNLGFDDAGLSQDEVHPAFKGLLEKYNVARDDYLLYLANAILVQKDFPVDDKYKADLKSLYQAHVQDMDFKADNAKTVESINRWVDVVTKGNIKSLVDSLDPQTVVVLLNAIYFKGIWEKQFDPKETRSLAFHNHGKRMEQKQVHMMQREDNYKFAHVNGVSAIELPYEGKDISMVILLPHELDGITKLEASLRQNIVRDLRGLMQKTQLNLFLPKFKIEYKKELSDVLKKLGIKKIFQSKTADLSGISSTGNLEVSRVNHKAVIEVNEEGSEAAGVTDIEVSYRSRMNLVVDRPFLFVIVDVKTNMILFQGRISEF